MTTALGESADGLLALALPRLAEAARPADTQRVDVLAQVVGLLEAARDGLATAASLAHESAWTSEAVQVAAEPGRRHGGSVGARTELQPLRAHILSGNDPFPDGCYPSRRISGSQTWQRARGRLTRRGR